MAENKHFAFVLKPDTARALLGYLHEIEMERGQRVTWDEAFRRLLAQAGRSAEGEGPGSTSRRREHRPSGGVSRSDTMT